MRKLSDLNFYLKYLRVAEFVYLRTDFSIDRESLCDVGITVVLNGRGDGLVEDCLDDRIFGSRVRVGQPGLFQGVEIGVQSVEVEVGLEVGLHIHLGGGAGVGSGRRCIHGNLHDLEVLFEVLRRIRSTRRVGGIRGDCELELNVDPGRVVEVAGSSAVIGINCESKNGWI